ncbi:glycoside hydrolase family 3 C-terminal domain-containing protein [Streptomyces sp. F63]|uniref:glycoside hydrolase family 3 protein n=1 Tax=Streptomyces sp. F63 TaxID=2824887 RepID=UPI001B359663|nr:glycoside hydrolase family 3 N-terminal domain-containing protein [Streptomyces sp. F63]MBQ0986847.1 glycoside hydrolase family 3 C-terminal domain-containing protein [Streptomyces sp. F63]
MPPFAHWPAWPRVASAVPADPAVEERVRSILARMTPEEKIGQLVQPELAELTPGDVRTYKIGSALNGAGIWPGGNRHADPADWVKTVDLYWEAAEAAYADRPFRVPFMWATDAVHGHNNVYGATIFPHNIGLGAARDPELLRRIGAATAREIAATGMDWTFAPTVTVPRDRRWGRYYEGWSEDPELVHAYAAEMVAGLQGGGGPDGLTAAARVISCVKHWVADGGTADGGDRGTCFAPEDLVRNLHAAGFVSGLAAGAQSVMASFSSWEDPANYDHSPRHGPPYNAKVHGSRYLLTDVLKRAMGFDGIVISDWDAHAEVAGCSVGNANYALNAGLDVLMVAGREAWRSVYRNALAGLRTGEIPAARIDDAVTRVLRVKMRAGLWDRPRPRDRALTHGTAVLGCAEHRALAREAVRKSVVLLKHTGGVLPLPRTSRVLVSGSGADDIRKQTGGWTLTWQGNDVGLSDLPGATTVAGAVREITGEERCTVDPYPGPVDPTAYDVALVVIGEDSYAEMRGTIKAWRSLAYSELKASYARDLETLRRLRAAGLRVVTVMLTGRPLYTTEEINLSDAFVVAWLPGTEGGGITDVLFAGPDGERAHDVRGRLGFSWPGSRRASAANRIPPHIPGYRVPPEEQEPAGEHAPLFPYGYGLSLDDADPHRHPLPLDTFEDTTPPPPAAGPLPVLGAGSGYRFRIGGHNTWSRVDVSPEEPVDSLIVRSEPGGQGDPPGALTLTFKGYPVAFVYAERPEPDAQPLDLRGYADDGGRLAFRLRITESPSQPLLLACHDDYPAQPGLDLTRRLAGAEPGRWCELAVPLAELADLGMDLRHVDVPFMLYTEGTAVVSVADVRWLPGSPGGEG